VLVLLFATKVGFVNLHNATEQGCVIAASLTETLEDEPGRLLCDSNLFCQLHGRDALTSRHHEVHGVNPLVQRDVETLEDGSGTHGEVLLTGVATVEATLADSDSGVALAHTARWALGPEPRFEVNPCGFLIGKQCEQLERADCACAHEVIVDDSLEGVKCYLEAITSIVLSHLLS